MVRYFFFFVCKWNVHITLYEENLEIFFENNVLEQDTLKKLVRQKRDASAKWEKFVL